MSYRENKAFILNESIKHVNYNKADNIKFFTPSEVEMSILKKVADGVDTNNEAELLDITFKLGADVSESVPELSEMLRLLNEQKEKPVLVINFPVEYNIPPTPDKYLIEGENYVLYSDILRGLVLGIAGWYGYGFTSQQNVIHNNIISIKEQYGIIGIATNPIHELGLHTEDASFNIDEQNNISPDFLTLSFIRNLEAVPLLLSAPDIFELGSENIKLLSSEFFYNKTNPGQGGIQFDSNKPQPILYGDSDKNPSIRFNMHSEYSNDTYSPEEISASEKLRELVLKHKFELVLTSGQLALIDNRRVLHGREKYSKHQMPKWDGKDRWQRRITVAIDKDRIKKFEVRPHIVDPSKLKQS